MVSDEGHIYRDSSAWIMCLYALEDYREWSLRLASPALRPFARQAFAFVSKHRSSISQWLLLFRWVGSVVPLAVTHVGSSPGSLVKGIGPAYEAAGSRREA